MSTTNLPEHILYRLMLSKHFINEAKSRLVRSKDEFSMSLVVVNFHDCIDNLCGAIASFKGIRLGRETFLLDVFAKVSEQIESAKAFRMEIEQLNSLRNSVKHVGLVPNPRAVLALAPYLERLCEDVSTECFGKPLSSITMADALANEQLKKCLQEVEHLIEKGTYKEALEAMAYIMFREFEHSYAVGPGGIQGLIGASLRGEEPPPPEAQKDVFPELGVDLVHRMFIELGIEPDLYYRFRELVPQCGYDNLRDKNVILKKNLLAWHERNWTEENCGFCLEFLTNFFVRRQKRYRGYRIFTKFTTQKVTFIRTSTFYGHVGDEFGADLPGKAEAGTLWSPCIVFDYVDGEWQNGSQRTTNVIVYGTAGQTQAFTVNKADIRVEELDSKYFDFESVPSPEASQEPEPNN